MMQMRLTREYNNIQKEIKKGTIQNVEAVTYKNKDGSIWNICIFGPKGSYYEGGKFNIEADFTDNYPFKPPKCKFTTKIYHPNVSTETGQICKTIYEDSWVPTK